MSREAGGQSLLAAHYRVDGHPRINPIQVKNNLIQIKPIHPIILVYFFYSSLGGGCWSKAHLPGVPPVPRRHALLREDEAETPGAKRSPPLPTDRGRCARGARQGHRAPGSQAQEIRLHRRVKVRIVAPPCKTSIYIFVYTASRLLDKLSYEE